MNDKFITLSNKIKKLLIIGDLHIQNTLSAVLFEVIQYAKKQNIDGIYLNGDILDGYMISSFNKIPNNPTLQTELNTVITFLKYLRSTFPKIPIYYKAGNHEYRLVNYLMKHSELFDMRCLLLNELLHLNNFNIQFIDDKTISIYNNFYILHGHEIKKGGIYAARNMLNYTKQNVIFGHLHVSDVYQTTNLKGEILTSIAVGHLGTDNPDYCPFPLHWNKGFLIIDKNGNFKNYKILNNKIV